MKLNILENDFNNFQVCSSYKLHLALIEVWILICPKQRRIEDEKSLKISGQVANGFWKYSSLSQPSPAGLFQFPIPSSARFLLFQAILFCAWLSRVFLLHYLLALVLLFSPKMTCKSQISNSLYFNKGCYNRFFI